MRVALVLVAVLGCSKQAADTGAKQTPSSAAGEPGSAPVAPPPPPPAGEGGAEGRGQALDQARAAGVLGPTEGSAFEEPVKPEPKSESKVHIADTAAGTGVRYAPPVPKATVTIPQASSDELMKASKERLGAVRACYDRSLAKQPVLAGQLTLAIKNDTVTVERSTIHDADLEKCVVAAIRHGALPKSATKASLLLVFKPE